MIIFKKLRWKNFLSTGNNFTEIDFLRNKSTLIVGQNGAGKSTLLDALSFALFGKSHRNISKPQLVNSVNSKHCVVEVEFNVSGNEWKIVRGIKPSIFEIWKGDVMINQDSHAKEYQKILEQNIIKLNHKSFHQIVVLGSSSFIPFMQLSAANRREVIEDLLDINVFSKMNVILKEKNNMLREQMREIQYKSDLLDNKIETQKKYLKDVKAINDDRKAQIQNETQALEAESVEIQKANIALSQYMEEHQESVQTALRRCQDSLGSKKVKEQELKNEIKLLVKETKFFETNDTCPTCSQDISDDFRSEKRSLAAEKAKAISEELSITTEAAAALESDLAIAVQSQEEIREKQHQLHSNNSTIQRIQAQIDSRKDELASVTSGAGDLQEAQSQLEAYVEEKNTLTESRLGLSDQRSYNEVIGEMLKDTGIKTKIVKQYIPIINKFVNKYLTILDFFVSFNLDESFQETIKSRHRDSFTYDSFSEGEKQRIDLALLFTWRLIAKMKNSVATNLLILDETFDSSLDQDGVENLMKIIDTLGDETNVFVISHKGDLLDGKFNSKIEFVKEKNFSKIK
jgi:DNA repair exonuclease SbcCD ATPase subunit